MPKMPFYVLTKEANTVKDHIKYAKKQKSQQKGFILTLDKVFLQVIKPIFKSPLRRVETSAEI